MAFLDIDQIVVRFGRVEVLRQVSLSVERGMLVALLGASGCGKTTLLRAVSGFGDVAEGRILLDGRDITALPPERRNTAMVFQSYALWPHMSVAQNIGYGLKLRRHSKPQIARKVDSLLGLLHLDGLGARNVTQLSGGQRQRVALGRALAIDPEVLLLDEPLSNLDAGIRVELRHEIRAIQARLGITALHVTHDREEAMVMADRIVVVDGGRIAQQGTPQEVYHRPASAFVARFMGADNRIRLDARPHDRGIALRPDGGGETVLPMGEAGAHVVAREPAGVLDGYFRSAAARLAPAGTAAPAGCLGLHGLVQQASYPGDCWRHTVAIGGTRFLIESAQRHDAGTAVNVVIPAEALHLYPAAP